MSSSEIIHIAYDRQNVVYIAYNVETKIFATGVSVDDAYENYRKEYYTQIDNAKEDGDYIESLKLEAKNNA